MRCFLNIVENADPARKMQDAFRVWCRANTPNCYIDFMPGDTPDEVEVDSLWIDPEHRGNGEASRALRMLCALADKYGITLSLAPVPTDDETPGLDSDDLRGFYRRCGFEWNHGDRGMPMIRTPQTE